MHRGRQPSGGLPPLLPVWVVHFPKTTTSSQQPATQCEKRNLRFVHERPFLCSLCFLYMDTRLGVALVHERSAGRSC